MTLNKENLPITLKISRAAEVLGWSRGKVYNMVRKGYLRSHKLGREHYVITEELFEDLKKK